MANAILNFHFDFLNPSLIDILSAEGAQVFVAVLCQGYHPLCPSIHPSCPTVMTLNVIQPMSIRAGIGPKKFDWVGMGARECQNMAQNCPQIWLRNLPEAPKWIKHLGPHLWASGGLWSQIWRQYLDLLWPPGQILMVQNGPRLVPHPCFMPSSSLWGVSFYITDQKTAIWSFVEQVWL